MMTTFDAWPKRWPQLLLLAGLASLIALVPLPWVLLGVAGGWGVVLLLRFPWVIWPLLAFALPFSSAISIGPASVTEVLLLLAVILWFVDGVRRESLQLKFSFPACLFFCYAMIQLALLSFAVDLVEAIPEVLKWVEILLVLLLLQGMMPPKRRSWVIYALLCAGISQGIWGVVQFLFQIGPINFLLFDRFMRASGTFAQPNPYAGYLGTLLPVALSLAFYRLLEARRVQREAESLNYMELLFFIIAASAITAGMLASWSRGGWLGTMAGLGAVLILRSRLAVVWSLVGGGVLILLLMVSSLNMDLIPSAVQERVGSVTVYLGVGLEEVLNEEVHDGNFSVIERMAHWKAAILIWQENWWVGVGAGGYETAYPQAIQQDLRLLLWENPLGHAHNIYLNILAETGVIGLLSYLTLFGSLLVWVGLKSGQSVLALGILGVFAHLATHNFFDNLYVQGIYLHLGFWLAILDSE